MAQANTSAAQLRLTYALLRFAFHWMYAWQSRLTPISGMHRSTACVHISNICNNARAITARLTVTENTVTILCDRGKSFHFVFIANSPYFSNIKLTAAVLPSSTCRQKTIRHEPIAVNRILSSYVRKYNVSLWIFTGQSLWRSCGSKG